MTDVRLAYGYQSWTTATHIERALRRLATVETFGPGHPNDTSVGASPMLWIESPATWLPSPTELERARSAAYLIDTHRGYRWRSTLAGAFDLSFTAQRPAAERFRAGGIDAQWLPLAAPSELCGPGADLVDRRYDVAFVGQAPPGSFRARVLDALASGLTVSPNDPLIEPPAMMELYKQARVVVNIPVGDDLNMRVFEATGARALLATSLVPGLEAVLPDAPFVSVAGADLDLWVAAVRRAVATSREAQAMADAAYHHVIAHHTYDHRAASILARLAETTAVSIDDQARRRALAAGWARWGRPREIGALGLVPVSRLARQTQAAAYAVATPTIRGLRRLRQRRRKNAP